VQVEAAAGGRVRCLAEGLTDRVEAVVRGRGGRLELAVPLSWAGESPRLLLGLDVRYGRFVLEYHPARWLELGGSPPSEPYLYCTAERADLPGVARVFLEAFGDAAREGLGQPPPAELVVDVAALCYDAEPGGLLICRRDGEVVGYVLALASLRRLWRTVLLRGHLLRWAWAWATGRYRLGVRALRWLLVDKFHFVRSSLRSGLPGPGAEEGRILSLAVLSTLRGRGLGARLLHHGLAYLARRGTRRVRLEVRPENERAVELYRRAAFQVRGSYEDSRGTWWIMVRDAADAAPAALPEGRPG